MKEVSEQEKALVFFENIEAPVLQKGSLKKLMSIMKISKDTGLLFQSFLRPLTHSYSLIFNIFSPFLSSFSSGIL
jgi:hypothetical protein